MVLVSYSNSRSKVCVKYAGPMELWNDAPVTPYEGQSGRRLSHLRLSANTVMLRTACFLCVIGHRELLGPESRRALCGAHAESQKPVKSCSNRQSINGL